MMRLKSNALKLKTLNCIYCSGKLSYLFAWCTRNSMQTKLKFLDLTKV